MEITTPTIRVIGSTYTDDMLLDAAMKASDILWKTHGILVDVEFENAGLVDHLGGVGYYEGVVVLRSGSETIVVDTEEVDIEELVEVLVTMTLRSLAKSNVEVVVDAAGPSRTEVLHAFGGAAS